jgi:hypothetical protein
MTTETDTLDARIAEALGLFEHCQGTSSFRWLGPGKGLEIECDIHGISHIQSDGSSSIVACRYAPPYSSRIEYAWRVIDAMRERGWLLSLTSWQNPPQWTARFERWSTREFGRSRIGADAPAAAIVLAALAALEGEDV